MMEETINPLQLISSDVSETEIHLYLDEKSFPPAAVLYNSKGFSEQSYMISRFVESRYILISEDVNGRI